MCNSVSPDDFPPLALWGRIVATHTQYTAIFWINDLSNTSYCPWYYPQTVSKQWILQLEGNSRSLQRQSIKCSWKILLLWHPSAVAGKGRTATAISSRDADHQMASKAVAPSIFSFCGLLPVLNNLHGPVQVIVFSDSGITSWEWCNGVSSYGTRTPCEKMWFI